jgi:flavodoxin I
MNGVLYYSLTGNTGKMAAGVRKDGLLFIGSGSYGEKPTEDMAKFIERNDVTGREVLFSGTSRKGAGLEVQGIEEALKLKDAKIISCDYCKGHPSVINQDRPGRDDYESARRFAREIANNN